MQDSTFALFLGFAFLWIGLGAGALIVLLKTESPDLKFGKQGLLVTLSVVLPFLIALIYGAVSLSPP